MTKYNIFKLLHFIVNCCRYYTTGCNRSMRLRGNFLMMEDGKVEGYEQLPTIIVSYCTVVIILFFFFKASITTVPL